MRRLRFLLPVLVAISTSAHAIDFLHAPVRQSPQAVPVAEPLMGETGPADQAPVAIGAADGVVRVLWRERVRNDTHRTFWRLFGPDKRDLGPPVELPAENLAAGLAAGEDRFLIVWSAPEGGVRAVRVRTDGTVLDDEPIVLSSDGREPSVTSNGRDFLVSWWRVVSHVVTPTTSYDVEEIRTTAVTAEGINSVHEGSAASETGAMRRRPMAAWNGRNYLLAWHAPVVQLVSMYRKTHGRFVSSAGTPEGEVMTLLDWGYWYSSIASSGREFLLVGAPEKLVVEADGSSYLMPWNVNGRPNRMVIWDGRRYVVSNWPVARVKETGYVQLMQSRFTPYPEDPQANPTRVYLSFFEPRRRAVQSQ